MLKPMVCKRLCTLTGTCQGMQCHPVQHCMMRTCSHKTCRTCRAPRLAAVASRQGPCQRASEALQQVPYRAGRGQTSLPEPSIMVCNQYTVKANRATIEP
jgi:hypothetical protein